MRLKITPSLCRISVKKISSHLQQIMLYLLLVVLVSFLCPGLCAAQTPASVNSTWHDPVTGMEFVRVPGGCFLMGSDRGKSDEKPIHKVRVGSFWMGKYEVTNAEFRQFRADHDSESYADHSLNDAEQPVVYVSWEDAVAFAKWLSVQSGKTFRLPTEAEWEYACRSGTTTVRYWGGASNQACRYANVADKTAQSEWSGLTVHDCSDGFKVASPVGGFQANSFGLYDMHGNVREWCADRYGNNYYSNSSLQNPSGPDSGSNRVYRGGGWYDSPGWIRSASRGRFGPGKRELDLGFRLVSPGRR